MILNYQVCIHTHTHTHTHTQIGSLGANLGLFISNFIGFMELKVLH